MVFLIFMFGDILLISLGLFGLLIATITDLKSREVPDYLNYFLISAGFGFRFFYSVLFLFYPCATRGFGSFSKASHSD